MINHYKAMQPIWDFNIKKSISLQCLNRNSPDFGGICDITKGFVEPAHGAGLCYQFLTAYYNPNSDYYRNDQAIQCAINAITFALNNTNDDGTIDLRETNFHDSTANGFTMQPCGYAYKLLNKYTKHTPLENELKILLHQYTVLSGDAMVNFGFHTPNHRWVISSALALCYNLTGDQKYRDHIQKFLDEGIDCDEEGEFTERSAGIYNVTCDRALIIIAEELNMPELYEHVTRNLYMVMKYFEPSETICTLNSTRQDVGKDTRFEVYYETYLYMAVRTNNAEFAWFADHMLSENIGRWQAEPSTALAYYDYIPQFLMEQGFVEKMDSIPTQKPDLNYDKYFVESGIVRKREGDTTLTLIKDRPIFLKFQHQNQKLFVRFAGSFFGPHAQFQAQDIKPIEGGYRLTYHKTKGYRRPFEQKQDTWVWAKMDHSKRENVCMQDFDVTVDVYTNKEELSLTVNAGGCDNIPFKLELMTSPGGVYSTPDTTLITRPGDYVFLKQGDAEYLYPDHTLLSIEGGFNKHWYGSNMRGAISGDAESLSIVMTCFTPEKHTVKVKFGLSSDI